MPRMRHANRLSDAEVNTSLKICLSCIYLGAAACGATPTNPPASSAQASASSSAVPDLDAGDAPPFHRASDEVELSPPDAGPSTGREHHEQGRTSGDIRALVVAHREEAKGCYRSALALDPTLDGHLLVQWTIDPKGNVTNVVVEGPDDEPVAPSLAGCVGDAIKRIHFAASAGGFE